MNTLLEKLAKSATDTTTFAKAIADAGVRYVETVCSEMKVLGSLHALAAKDIGRDETHYLLVPSPSGNSKFSVYTKRVIPDGEGAESSLPKVRIFHLPDQSALKTIEDLLVASAASENLADKNSGPDFSRRLEECADQIDRKVEEVGGGLLFLGGVIICLNPIVGIGMAATGLLSAAGSKMTKMGASYVGDRMRAADEEKSKKAARRLAEKSVRKLKPEVFENPMLKSLDAVLNNPDTDYDPFLDDRNRVDAFGEYRRFAITVEAISNVFAEETDRAMLSGTHRGWLEHLIELNGEDA